MSFLVLVVDRSTLLDDLEHRRRIQSFPFRRQIEDTFQQIDEITAVAVGQFGQRPPCLGRHRQFALQFRFGPLRDLFEGIGIQRIHNEHFATGKQCAVQLEGGILRRGADQSYGTVFHIREEAILLRPVEPVNLVDEKQCSLAVFAPLRRLIERLAQISDSGKHRRERGEMKTGAGCHHPGQRRFATAGRPPENKTGQMAGVDHPAQRRPLAEQMLLTDNLIEVGRPEPVRQRPVDILRKK